MSAEGLNRHVVTKGNAVLGERYCQSCKRHHKLAAFDDNGSQCRHAQQRRANANAAIAKRKRA